MTKYDFKLKRGVFRSGNIKSRRDFKSFEKGFKSRKQAESRMRIIIIMIAIIMITILLLFTIQVYAATGVSYQQELKIENINKILNL